MKATTKQNGTSGWTKRLYVALELSEKSWLVGSATGQGERARQKTVRCGDSAGLLTELDRARKHFGLSVDAPVSCCYEAGRDGFWLCRLLLSTGIECHVVDAGSMRRRRGKRHVKTDRLDVETLLQDLIRYEDGDDSVWRTVKVPSESSEDLRQLQRSRQVLKSERVAHMNRIRGLLVSRGVRMSAWSAILKGGVLERMRTWDGSELGRELLFQLNSELERLKLVKRQLRELACRRKDLLKERPEEHRATLECVDRLLELSAVGEETAWTCATELFGWRAFKNRKQVGGFLGLCGTPYSSGGSERDLGIGKDGPGWVRALAIELAWGWLRHQPDSAHSRWFQERYGPHGKRNRRRGIVALARRLMVSLWAYIDHGLVPTDAVLKNEVKKAVLQEAG